MKNICESTEMDSTCTLFAISPPLNRHAGIPRRIQALANPCQ